ncbi:MAG: hypothetical protein ACI4J0_04920 [Huintestinicola sp.]|uniref:hypothetical protein n=1 Tax=Huintestinicola sp. TaxID=2981661 RepID=UPI003F010025
MPENDILNVNPDLIGDFELPPLPKRPAKLSEGVETLEKEPSDGEIDAELPPLPEKTVDNSLDAISDRVSSDALEDAVSENVPDELDGIDTDDDFELPPLPEVKKEEKPSDDDFIIEEEEPEDDGTDETFDFTDDYDLPEPDKSSLVLEDLSASVRPIRSGREESARNMREAIKMNDLSMEVGSGPVLDDLSNEYKAPEAQASDLMEKDKLDDDQKRILRQRLNEDLGKRPENFNARASQNIANRLLEEKRLKIAKKGFTISIIPIIMGLASAAICFFKLNWGDYQWFPYVAPFMLLASLMLLIKSKHVKMLSVSIYGVCALIYAGVGLVLFTLNNSISDGIVHIIFGIAAVALNVISILILIKNEAVNTYYSGNFKKR